MGTTEGFSNRKPLISIVMPVYKAEPYLPRAVESILQQSYKNWELLLVDDGSPDASGALCDAYAKKYNRIHAIHQKNRGQAAARNSGICSARGDYLYFVDADDYIAPTTLQVLLDYALPGNVDIVMHGHYYVQAEEIKNSTDWQPSTNTEEIRDAILVDRIPNFPVAKLFRKSLWKDVQFPVGVWMEDMYVMPLLFYKAKRISLITDPLYYYCRHSGSTMNPVDVDAYVRVRYGKFLAWKEHAEKAQQYRPAMERTCTAHALHSALRTYTMTCGTDILAEADREKVRAYLSSCDTEGLPWKLRLARVAILHGPQFLTSLAGSFQRALVSRQQKHRANKMAKRK